MSEQVNAFLALAPYGEVVEGVRASLEHGAGIIKIIGDKGTGKSACCTELARRLPDARVDVLLLDHPPPSVAACETLLRAHYPLNEYASLHRALKGWLKRGGTLHCLVLIVDEAQESSDELLEMLRLLTRVQDDGRPLVRLILAGTGTLDERLASPACVSLREHIDSAFELGPLSPDQAHAFYQALLARAGLVRHRLDDRAIDLLHQQSRGLPGALVGMCEDLLAARTALPSTTITARNLRAAMEPEETVPAMQPATVANIVGGVLLVIALSFGAIGWLQSPAPAATASNETSASGMNPLENTLQPIATAALIPDQPQIAEAPASLATQESTNSAERGPVEEELSDRGQVERAEADMRRNEANFADAAVTETDSEDMVFAETAIADAVPGDEHPVEALFAEAIPEGRLTVESAVAEALVPGEAPPPRATELAASVQRWLDDWQQQDVSGYLAHYHPDFAPLYHSSVAQWREERAARLRAPQSISLSYDRFEVIQADAERATVRFWMHYRSPTYADETWKELRLRLVDEGWRILVERNLETRVLRP